MTIVAAVILQTYGKWNKLQGSISRETEMKKLILVSLFESFVVLNERQTWIPFSGLKYLIQ